MKEGLELSMRAPFSVLEPTAAETPVIVEVPHAGLWLDGPALSTLSLIHI